MPRLKIFYILALMILGALLVFTIFRPMATGGEYSEVQRESLLRAQDKWIVQFDLLNLEGKEQKYTIQVSIDDGKPYKEDVLLGYGGMFTFIRRIPFHEIKGEKGKATFIIYKEGETTPFEEIDYFLVK